MPNSSDKEVGELTEGAAVPGIEPLALDGGGEFGGDATEFDTCEG